MRAENVPVEDAPEPEGAKEFYEWMRERGCTGEEMIG